MATRPCHSIAISKTSEALIKSPSRRSFIIRTPAKRTPNVWKQPHIRTPVKVYQGPFETTGGFPRRKLDIPGMVLSVRTSLRGVLPPSLGTKQVGVCEHQGPEHRPQKSRALTRTSTKRAPVLSNSQRGLVLQFRKLPTGVRFDSAPCGRFGGTNLSVVFEVCGVGRSYRKKLIWS